MRTDGCSNFLSRCESPLIQFYQGGWFHEVTLKEMVSKDTVFSEEPNSLHDAVRRGEVEKARFLLEHGADVNSQDSFVRNTPLHYAVQSGNTEMVELLLDHGARIQIKNVIGEIPFSRYQLIENPIEREKMKDLLFAFARGLVAYNEWKIENWARRWHFQPRSEGVASHVGV